MQQKLDLEASCEVPEAGTADLGHWPGPAWPGPARSFVKKYRHFVKRYCHFVKKTRQFVNKHLVTLWEKPGPDRIYEERTFCLHTKLCQAVLKSDTVMSANQGNLESCQKTSVNASSRPYQLKLFDKH